MWIEDSDSTATEAGPTRGELTVHRDVEADTSSPLATNVQATQGTGYATLGSDYAFTPAVSAGTVTIPAGLPSLVIRVTPVNDTEVEGDETVSLEILDGDYVIGSPAQASVTIVDDDWPGQFSLTDPPGGATEVDERQDIVLKWGTPDPAADSFTLLVAENTSFSSPAIPEQSTTGTTYEYTIDGGTLSPDKHYFWKVTATNVAGTTGAANNPLHFHTRDTISPEVSGTDPSDGDDDADTQGSIKIIFSEPMKEDNMLNAFSLVDSLGGTVTGTPSFTVKTLTFTPERDLEYLETYTGTLDPTGLVDLAGNPLDVSNDPSGVGTNYVFSFRAFEPLVGLGAGEGCVPSPGALGPCAALLVVAMALGRRRA
jgi:hypothetical protein